MCHVRCPPLGGLLSLPLGGLVYRHGTGGVCSGIGTRATITPTHVRVPGVRVRPLALGGLSPLPLGGGGLLPGYGAGGGGVFPVAMRNVLVTTVRVHGIRRRLRQARVRAT